MTDPLPRSAGLRLGFGGSLGGEIGYRESCALVEAAFEAGIRHFDVAPSYGGGRAERILGDVLASVRPQVTLVSKAGIAHPRGSGLIRAVRMVVKPLKKRFPALWQRTGVKVRRAAAPIGRFAVADVKASFEETLRRLRTDYLDALLLHEVQPGDMSVDLEALLADLQREGRARVIGTGSGVAASLELMARHPRLFAWVQTDHYWGAFLPALRQGRHLVTHGVLRKGLELVQRPEFHAAARRSGAAEVLAATADARTVGNLLLRAALAQVGDSGGVVVSTNRMTRLREIIAAARGDPDPALTSRFNAVLQDLAG